MSTLFFQLHGIVHALKEQNELTKKIEDCAKLMLLHYSLYIEQAPYQILEVEFYLNNGTNHADSYAHSAQYPNRVKPKQGTVGAWYFHRFTRISTYTHTRRGLDLTLGEASCDIYGGILIRTIRGIDDGRLISGPSRVVGEIIRTLSDKTIVEQAVDNTVAGYAFNSHRGLFLKEREQKRSTPIFKSPRIGLGKKNADYRLRNYRFFTDPDILKKPTVGEVIPCISL